MLRTHTKKRNGKRLLNAVSDLAKISDCKRVRRQVSRWNTNSIESCRSMGAQTDAMELNCDLPLE